MAENLAYLPSVNSPPSISWSSPHYYVYGYQGTSVIDAKATDNYSTYGVLYNWPAAMQSCPDGWHLPIKTEEWPIDTEWTTLIDYLGGTNFAGGKLKEAGTTHWNSPNIGATNETGFTALPGGNYGLSAGSFSNLGRYAFFWSAAVYYTTEERHRAYCYLLDNYSTYVWQSRSHDKFSGFSVRCLKD